MRFLVFPLIAVSMAVHAQDTTAYTKQEVIYGRKDGMALTMLVIKPARSNNRGVISLVSGNWRSSFNNTEYWPGAAMPYVSKGYTVFAVVHGSQPRYAIPDAVADVKRAVQFIRYHATEYGISPDYIGITGKSSGGHLSLMAGTSNDSADPSSKDPVARVSSKVQAVACFFPPTDFLNWGMAGLNPSSQKMILQTLGVLGAFQFTKFDSVRNVFVTIEDTAGINAIARTMSPAQLVTSDDAPVFIIHGDADNIVPLQQSQLFKQKMEAVGLPVNLIIKKGAGHGWKDIITDEKLLTDWFDQYLKVKK